ncbi:MAG: glutaredoxin family protein [Burkholderiaceae bacterium]
MKCAPTALLLAAGLLWAAGASAQLYKSVGPDGRVTYSDTPPPSAARVERTLPNRTRQTDALPPELAAARHKNPVTLYTTENCKPCSEGRALLQQRGIPFAEKTVHSNEDLAALRQAGGDQQLPLLTVGSQKQQGFEADAWHATLAAAGYPETSQLPKSYQNPAAVPAAPPKPVAAAKPPAPEQNAGAAPPPPPAGNAPPGFQF